MTDLERIELLRAQLRDWNPPEQKHARDQYERLTEPRPLPRRKR
jgi:hypothetical protein